MSQLSGSSAPTDAISDLDKRLVEDRKDVIGLSDGSLRKEVVSSSSWTYCVTAYARLFLHKLPTYGQTLLLFKNPQLIITIGTDLCT